MTSQKPTIQDCLGAVPICDQVYNEVIPFLGYGPYRNEIDPEISCLENDDNAVWYTFTVNASGMFGFSIRPTDIGDDFDWALYDLTDATCADILTDPSILVSCNSAGGSTCDGGTGATGRSTFDIQGTGCGNSPPDIDQALSADNALIPVLAGNTYALLVLNWRSSATGYNIDFGLSQDIGINDDIPPEVKSAKTDTTSNCPPSQITIEFSEFIQCSSIHENNFTLSDDTGNLYDITLFSTNCDIGADYSRSFDIVLQEQLTLKSTYRLVMSSTNQFEILDLCHLKMTDDYSFEFDISIDPLQDLMLSDTTLCTDDILIIDLSDPDATQYLWQDGNTNSAYTINQSGEYKVSVSNECYTSEDSLTVEIITEESRNINLDLGSDTILCSGSTIMINTDLGDHLLYDWNDGNTNHPRTISSSGQYILTVSDECGPITADSINIDFTDLSLTATLMNDTLLCTSDMINLSVLDPNAKSYEWSNGSNEANIIVTRGGVYSVTITNQCESKVLDIDIIESSCVSCNVYIPNSLSINSNIGNDIFTISSNCSFQNYNLKIFDRWGGLIFKSQDPHHTWDGTIYKKGNGRSGTFVYSLEYSYVEFGILIEKHTYGDIFLSE